MRIFLQLPRLHLTKISEINNTNNDYWSVFCWWIDKVGIHQCAFGWVASTSTTKHAFLRRVRRRAGRKLPTDLWAVFTTSAPKGWDLVSEIYTLGRYQICPQFCEAASNKHHPRDGKKQFIIVLRRNVYCQTLGHLRILCRFRHVPTTNLLMGLASVFERKGAQTDQIHS